MLNGRYTDLCSWLGFLGWCLTMSSLWLLPAYAIYKYNITEVIIIIYYLLSLLMAAPCLGHFQVQHYFSLSLISKSSAILISSLFSQLDLAKRRAFYRKKSITNRDIRSGDFWRETAEDHTTRGDVAHLNLQGHKACHASGKRPVNRTKTKIIITATGEPHNKKQDQLQEQRRLLHHHRNRPVGVRKAKKAQTIKNPKSWSNHSRTTASIQGPNAILFIKNGKI